MGKNIPKRGYLFDFDGTLAQSLPHWADAYTAALTLRGKTVDRSAVLAACFGSRSAELLERLQVSDQPQFREDVWTAVEQRVHLFQPYQGVLELLAELRTTGCGLAVVTNSRRSHVEPALKRWEASHLFDTLVSIEDVSYGKPDPEAIHKALNTLHVSPVDAFMIGDSPADLLAGSRALVRTVAFSPEQNRAFFPAELLLSHAPNHTTGSYSELRSLLLENV